MALKEELENQGNWLFRHRSILPVAVLLIALCAMIQVNLQNRALQECDQIFELLCLIVSLFGFAIRIYTVGHSARNTSGRNTSAGQVAETLNTTGIYSTVRHPLYLGNFFMWLGPALFTNNGWFIVAFILFYFLYYERIMFAEEQFLERKFGQLYSRWAEKVPAFIPDIRKFKPSYITFSLKKVLEKEKSGLLGMFSVFAFFDLADELVARHTHYNLIFVIGTAAAMVLYLAIKMIRKRTVIFNEI
jgi:protein-S-isoprenylcysteine O-methyltransferase Ste14